MHALLLLFNRLPAGVSRSLGAMLIERELSFAVLRVERD